MRTLMDAIRHFFNDDCPRMAAALSYYTVFSLPGLLVITLVAAGLFADPVELRRLLVDQVQALAGGDVAGQVDTIMRNFADPGGSGPIMAVIGIGVLLFAATASFSHLQHTLNRAWQVAPDPEKSGVRVFFVKRVVSFLMILSIALLLLVALLAQTLITAFGGLIAALLPDPAIGPALHVASFALSLAVVTALFALIFQVLPDAEVRWRDAWIGAGVTGVLFLLGNILLGLYLSRGDPGSAFGAAGSLAVILVWIYYQSMILFFGAELTQAVAQRRGEPIRPSRGAVRMVTEPRRLDEEEDPNGRQEP